MVPVFEPTLEEFESLSFEEYVAKAEALIDPNIGCFKVSSLQILVNLSIWCQFCYLTVTLCFPLVVPKHEHMFN